MVGTASLLAGAAIEYHCAGSAQLLGDSHLVTLQKVLALPATTNLETLAEERFSDWLTNFLGHENSNPTASLIEPLLKDIVENESLGQFGSASVNEPGFILAVHLSGQRRQLWQDNAGKILGGNSQKFSVQQFDGLRWTLHDSHSNSFWIVSAQDWLLAGCGDNFSSAQLQYLSQIKSQGRPAPALEGDWLQADISSVQIGGWFRYLKPATIRITVRPKEDNLQVEARISEENAVAWTSNPWQIPKDLMRGQVISFTAGQDVAAFLKLNSGLSSLDANPLTNQFFFWALDQMPMLNYMAWPESNASNALEKLSTELPAMLNPDLKRFNGTELIWHPEAGKLVWHHMGLFVPGLQAEQKTNGQFLFFSSFPRSKGKPMPDALLAQIGGRTNLVYYNWELTGKRLQEWEILSRMISNRSLGKGKDVIYKSGIETEWFGSLARLVGNTVTEITRSAPNELSVTRKAPVGLSALELVSLADWLCDADSGPIHSLPPAGNSGSPPGHR